MDVTLLGLLVLVPGLFFGSGLIAAVVAARKGYRPWFWLLSAGPFGALLILLKPNLRTATTPEQRERWERQMDLAGGILSGFTLFAMFAAIAMIALFGVYVARSAAPVVTSVISVRAPTTDGNVNPAKPEATGDDNSKSSPNEPQ